MAKDLGNNSEKVIGVSQNADTSLPRYPGQTVRYWHRAGSPTNQKSASNARKPGASTSKDVNIFQIPISSGAVTTIELLKSEPSEVVELQSSDEDEVVEIALPPKPTITIESSDDDSAPVVVAPSTSTLQVQPQRIATTTKKPKKKQKNKRRADSTSPVPSIVSSVSDDFIRGDCVAFNITRRQEVERFDLSLHGADLLEQHSNTLDLNNSAATSQRSKKKRNKKNKDKSATPQPVLLSTSSTPTKDLLEHSFSTPQNRKINKIYTVDDSSIPNADIYESDSNQSALIESVTETVSVQVNSNNEQIKIFPPEIPSPTQASSKPVCETPKLLDKQNNTLDLTTDDVVMIEKSLPVEDNLIMGNVSGLEPNQSPPPQKSCNSVRNESSKSVCRPKSNMSASDCQNIVHSSKESCREKMEHFYNDSWGGEDFDHRQIQQTMPRDKNLWMIDPRDRMISSGAKRRCHYCNQVGHVYERCRYKRRVCHMCGSEGHYEPRCPKRMCLRCGTPNSIYSIHCRNCAHWNRVFCDICQTYGHPVKNCPDLWRRYHSTIANDGILLRQQMRKKREELFCSGCTRRGHLAHSCHQFPYSALPLYSPFAFQYRPVFPPSIQHQYPAVRPAGRYFTMLENVDSPHQNRQQQSKYLMPETAAPITENNQLNTYSHDTTLVSQQQPRKRQAPAYNEPASKRCSLSNSEAIRTEFRNDSRNILTPPTLIQNDINNKKRSASNSEVTNNPDNVGESCAVSSTTNEEVLQDNEVSNTNDFVRTAKIYIEKKVMEELKKPAGMQWLNATSVASKVHVSLEENPTTFITVSGLTANQESFQNELRQYVAATDVEGSSNPEPTGEAEDNNMDSVGDDNNSKHIPKKKQMVLRMLNQALQSLQKDLGEPKVLYKELIYLQNLHKKNSQG